MSNYRPKNCPTKFEVRTVYGSRKKQRPHFWNFTRVFHWLYRLSWNMRSASDASTSSRSMRKSWLPNCDTTRPNDRNSAWNNKTNHSGPTFLFIIESNFHITDLRNNRTLYSKTPKMKWIKPELNGSCNLTHTKRDALSPIALILAKNVPLSAASFPFWDQRHERTYQTGLKTKSFFC